MKGTDEENRIGFKIRNSKLELILPSFIKDKNLDKEEETKEKIKYFKLLRKYKNSTKELKEEHLQNIGGNQKEEYMYSLFEAYYLLLMDYIKMGPFLFTEIKTNQNIKGRLNWNKTINKSKLLISENNFLYSNPLFTNKNIQYNHPLTIIYGIHLLEIEKATGLNINIHGQYRNIIEKNRKTINIGRILTSFRANMYSDRERKVIKLLYIINDNNKKLDRISTNASLYYLENLNNIWEFMLKSILDDQYYEFNKYFPNGHYNLNIEGKSYKKIGLRIIPDIIKEYNNKLYIIDAKNYLPHINGNTPGSVDINKQILYRYFLSREFNNKNKYELQDIKNIFLLPNDLQGEIIKKIGTHKITNMKGAIGDIFLYQIDFNHTVDAYIKNDKKIKEKILNTIENDQYSPPSNPSIPTR